MSEFPVLIEAFIRKKQEDKEIDFCPMTWLDSASKRASQIAVATHVLKFSNSDAKGTNIYSKADSARDGRPHRYVTTDTLRHLREDVVGNAAAMDIAGLLQLEVNGVTFLELIAKNDTTPLAHFADTEERLLLWMQGFKSILFDRELSSHTLAKQIYFPLESGEYHLLAPLYASSLSQALYDRIQENRFGEKAKEARDCRKNEKYSDASVINYPDLALQMFGGTKPQNISRLNSLRAGKSFLLKSVPPFWKSIKHPMKKNSFWKSFEKEAAPDLKEFKQFLKSVQKRDNNKDIRDQRHSHVKRLVSKLILLASEIQAKEPGWSVDSEIPLHEKLWLDPFCEGFEEIRYEEPWKESISNRFARWLIGKLKKEYEDLSDMDHLYLSEACLEDLKEVE